MTYCGRVYSPYVNVTNENNLWIVNEIFVAVAILSTNPCDLYDDVATHDGVCETVSKATAVKEDWNERNIQNM